MPRPTDTVGDAVASVAADEIPGIVAEVRAAFNTDITRSKGWRLEQLEAFERMMTEGEEEMCEAIYKDLHKSKFDAQWQELAMTKAEIYEMKHNLDNFMADEIVNSGHVNSLSTSYIQRDPLGVVLVLGAWNYPILLQLQPVAAAIAAGNCVIMKPGSYSKNVATTITRLINKYMDTSCIRCIEGNRTITSALLEQKFDKIFFTGSPYVGKIIAEAAAKTLTPVVLELGGKSPCIIDRTADLYVAAHRSGWGALMNSGQTCVRPDYFMVHEEIADKFISELIAVIKKFYNGNPQQSEWFGRLINDSAYKRLMKCVNNDGQYIVHGGGNDAAEKFIEPTIFDFKNDFEAFKNSDVMQDELFGPLIPIYRYSDLDDEVLQFIRAGPKPLALYCFTTDNDIAERTLRLTSSGAAVVNDVVVHLGNPNLPFGGVGDSGMGSYHGKFSFDTFSHLKAVVKRSNYLDLPQRYAPYSSLDQVVLGAAMQPHVGHYYNVITDTLSDKKNLAIMAMGTFILRNMFKSKL